MRERDEVARIGRESLESLWSENDRLSSLYEDQTQHNAVIMAQNSSLQDRVNELEQQIADMMQNAVSHPSGPSGPEGTTARSQPAKELDETLKSFVVQEETAAFPAGGSLPAGAVVGSASSPAGGSLPVDAVTPFQAPKNVPPGRADKDREAIAVLEAIGRRNEGVMGSLSRHGVILPGGDGNTIPVARNTGPDATAPSEYCGGPGTTTFGLPDQPLPESCRGDLPNSTGRVVGWSSISGTGDPHGASARGNTPTAQPLQTFKLDNGQLLTVLNAAPQLLNILLKLN